MMNNNENNKPEYSVMSLEDYEKVLTYCICKEFSVYTNIPTSILYANCIIEQSEQEDYTS